jgi:hypothetical protein
MRIFKITALCPKDLQFYRFGKSCSALEQLAVAGAGDHIFTLAFQANALEGSFNEKIYTFVFRSDFVALYGSVDARTETGSSQNRANRRRDL